MTLSGWIIMFISVGTVTALLAWCVYKVFSIPHETERMHAVGEETPDAE